MDEQAREDFRSYVAARSPALLRTAYLLTGNRSDAEDLLQTALAKTYLAWDRIREREAVDGYVRRVMVNTQTSWWRRRKVDEHSTDQVPERPGRDVTDDVALHDALWTALAQLPKRQRAMVVLRYYEDLSEAETAKVMNVSVGTVKSTTSRALAKLRDDSGLRNDPPDHPSYWSDGMKPLDDELRAVLSSRADSLPLVSDPIVGIERRARRMRRNRVAASLAGTALAVSAIAVAVPTLTTSSSDSLPPPDVAVTPTEQPTPAAASPYALDPANPWGYRGDSTMYDDGSFATFQRDWATRRPGSQLLPLFGQVYEPSGQFELVFAARDDSTGEARWGVVQSSEGGSEFLLDAPLDDPDRLGLAVALAGDENARLLVVADPLTTVQYNPPASMLTPMTELAGGVAVGPLLEKDYDGDYYAVRAPDGAVLKLAEAPDPARAPAAPEGEGAGLEDEGPGTDSPPLAAPTNVVDWPTRGTVDNALYAQALRAFARETGAAPEAVDAKVLYAGSRDDRSIMLLQAWTRGEDARAFGYLEAAGNETTWLGEYTAPGPAAFGLLLPAAATFLPSDLVLVVPEPAAGQVLYSADGSSEPQPVADQGTEVAVLIDRAPGVSGDRILVLDGDGDPDRPILRGTVADLLATF